MGNTPAPTARVPDYFQSVNVSLRASPTTPTEELLPVSGTVLRGVNAEPGEFPHQVALRIPADPDGREYFADCGASIIHPFLLLTAAHCVHGPDRQHIQAIAGVYQQSDRDDGNRQILSIRSFIIHPDFDEDALENDIAIITLDTLIQPNEFVQVIDIRDTEEPLPGAAYVSGWGSTGEEPFSDILQKALLTIVDPQTCRERTGASENAICAGGRRDACFGDSGGPLTCEDDNERTYLCGITSWGDDCEKKYNDERRTAPGVFVDVRKYYGWIRSHMRRWWRHYWNTLIGQPLIVSGECGAGRFKCGISGLCLPDGFRCDGENDCAPWDDSDERDCQNVTCPVGSFVCEGTRRCVAEKHVCDWLDDCGDGSDERNCH